MPRLKALFTLSRPLSYSPCQMQHLVLFLYFLFLSSGFAGITVAAILAKRTGETFLYWILALLVTFTVWLMITMIVYYVEDIIRYPFPTRPILGGVNFFVGSLAYLCLLMALFASPAVIRRWRLLLALIPIGLYYLVVILGTTLLPALLAPAAEYPHYYGMFSVLSGSIFVAYIGAGYLRGAKSTRRETLAFILAWFGRAMLIFALLILLLGLFLLFSSSAFQPAIMVEFVFFFSCNIIVIVAFIRYLIRPSALLEEGKISRGFIKEYGISPRECEIIELISQGMSNKEIASFLNVSFTTVRTHVYNIFKKVEVGSRVDLLRIVSGYRE